MKNDINWKDKAVDVLIGVGLALFSYWLSQAPSAPQEVAQAAKSAPDFFTLSTVQSSPLVTIGQWASGIFAAIMLLKGLDILDIFDSHDAVSALDSDDISDLFS